MWKPVPGFPGYEANEDGSIRSWVSPSRGRVLRPSTTKNGYKMVVLVVDGKRRGRYVHRLVLSAFGREPLPGEMTRHLDGDRSNNRISNLAWGSNSENVRDAIAHGTFRGFTKGMTPWNKQRA